MKKLILAIAISALLPTIAFASAGKAVTTKAVPSQKQITRSATQHFNIHSNHYK